MSSSLCVGRPINRYVPSRGQISFDWKYLTIWEMEISYTLQWFFFSSVLYLGKNDISMKKWKKNVGRTGRILVYIYTDMHHLSHSSSLTQKWGSENENLSICIKKCPWYHPNHF